MALQNMAMTLGFKGSGKPNGVPAYNSTGVYTLGGVQNAADAQTMKYGVVVNSDPVGDDGIFSVGALVQAGVASVFTMTVTAPITANGNINIDGTVIAVTTAGQGTIANLATAIRAGVYTRWNISGSGNDIIFTAKSATVYPQPTKDFGATGGAATIATTTAGTVGSVSRGVVIYRPDIAMNDPAKPDTVLQGTPLAVAFFGPIWLGAYTKTAAATIDPVVGCDVIAKNDTGIIEFRAAGAGAPGGWTKINASVKSVSLDTNGILLFLNM